MVYFLLLTYGLTLTGVQAEIMKDQLSIDFDLGRVLTRRHLEPNLNVKLWSQRNSNGQITVPWTAIGFAEGKLEELLEAMSAMEREVSCMRFPYVSKENLNSIGWARGVIFSWNDQSLCSSKLGFEPGFGIENIEVESRGMSTLLFRSFIF